MADKTTEKIIENSHYIEENTRQIQSNTLMIHILYGTVTLLMVIIAALAYYIGTLSGGANNTNNNGSTPTTGKGVEITIVDDERCSDCPTDEIVTQLKTLPFLSEATFEMKDFSDSGISDLLKENKITALPAIIFNTNSLGDNGQLTQFMTSLPDGQFNLAVGAKFNPFAKRSEKGFLLLEDDTLKNIKANSYIQGKKDAQITWVEYSDVQCPYCAKLHNDETPKKVLEKYSDSMNIIFQHFPLDFHAQAQKGAEGLECIAEQNETKLYDIIAAIYKKYPKQDVTIPGLIDIAGEAGINKETLNTCIDSGKYEKKVQEQMAVGQEVFGITGTPGNVIINSKTGEYEIVSGAYGAETFEGIIERMLAE